MTRVVKWRLPPNHFARSHPIKYSIREFESESKFIHALQVDALYQVIPPEAIADAVRDAGRRTQRVRKLNLVITVCVVVALYLFPHCSVGRVLMKLAQGVRLLWGAGDYRLAGDSAIAYRRTQLGVPPLALLARRVLHPLAQPDTPGAFLRGLRLVALDGTVDIVPDTPANVKVFGRSKTQRGISVFPQLRGVHLVECGTHAMLDCTFWPYRIGERRGAFRLMRSVQPDWLVMWDGGMHNFDLFRAVRAHDAQVLAILPGYVRPIRIERLADGSSLAYLRPSDRERRLNGERVWVRIIEYRLPEAGDRVFRLVTTLLDPAQYPALELAVAYHSRWEFEVSMDEIETHQRLTDAPFRGLTPTRVLQEAYGLVLAHYVVRSLMFQAAQQAGLAPTRLSFVRSVELVRQAVIEFQLVAPVHHPDLRQRLMRDLAATPLPERRLRAAPRVVKRRVSKYPSKGSKHLQPQQPQTTFRNRVTLLI